MKKFIALCLLAFNIAASALAAEIPYIGRVQPEYRAAAEGYLIEATSPQDVERRVKNYVPAQSSITFETVNAKSLYGAADVPLYIYRPAKSSDAKLPVVYYAHGGGYLFRISLDDRERYQNIANALNAAVVTPRYRLSVEAPFPAALEDAYSGLMYVKENADKLGLDAGRIILMGDSAGGNLAASLALYNRDNANIPIKGQVLIYPMLDYRTATENSPYMRSRPVIFAGRAAATSMRGRFCAEGKTSAAKCWVIIRPPLRKILPTCRLRLFMSAGLTYLLMKTLTTPQNLRKQMSIPSCT